METSSKKLAHYRVRGQEVLVDFDGTLCEFNYPKLGSPRPGAIEFLRWLVARGLKPVIWSSRMSPDNCRHADDPDAERHYQAWAIKRWLARYGFPDMEVDDGLAGKRLALAYVDDRGVAADSDTEWQVVKRRIAFIHDRETARWKDYDERSQADRC